MPDTWAVDFFLVSVGVAALLGAFAALLGASAILAGLGAFARWAGLEDSK
jgi:hypothetical protein